MNALLWVLQVLFGLYFIGVGVLHFAVPEGLPELTEWMYDLPEALHITAGIVEILGGLGLILPAVTGIQPGIVPLAALGLALVMVGGEVWHAGRDDDPDRPQRAQRRHPPLHRLWPLEAGAVGSQEGVSQPLRPNATIISRN